jgi:hypothetical protein
LRCGELEANISSLFDKSFLFGQRWIFWIQRRKENERENPSKLCGIYQKKIDSAEFLHDMAMG